MGDTYTTAKGVQLTVGQLYTDIYRDSLRVIAVVEIAAPRTGYQGRTRCEVSYRVVVRDGARVTSSRLQRMDAERLADPKLYRLVEDEALAKWVRS